MSEVIHKIRELKWELPKYTAKAARLQEAVTQIFPNSQSRDTALSAVQQILMRHAGKDVKLFIDSIDTINFGAVSERFGDLPIAVVFGAPPLRGRLLVHIDHLPAGSIVDRILGGNGERGLDPLPLSETELGVLQFLLMQCCAQLHRALGDSSPFFFRFERFSSQRNALNDLFAPTEETAVVSVRVGIGDALGLVRIILPESLANEIINRVQSQMQPSDIKDRALRFSTDPLLCWLEAGRTELMPADLAAIEPGDIILFDQASVTLQNGKVTGSITMRTGQGEHGGLVGEVDPNHAQSFVVKGA